MLPVIAAGIAGVKAALATTGAKVAIGAASAAANTAGIITLMQMIKGAVEDIKQHIPVEMFAYIAQEVQRISNSIGSLDSIIKQTGLSAKTVQMWQLSLDNLQMNSKALFNDYAKLLTYRGVNDPVTALVSKFLENPSAELGKALYEHGQKSEGLFSLETMEAFKRAADAIVVMDKIDTTKLLGIDEIRKNALFRSDMLAMQQTADHFRNNAFLAGTGNLASIAKGIAPIMDELEKELNFSAALGEAVTVGLAQPLEEFKKSFGADKEKFLKDVKGAIDEIPDLVEDSVKKIFTQAAVDTGLYSPSRAPIDPEIMMRTRYKYGYQLPGNYAPNDGPGFFQRILDFGKESYPPGAGPFASRGTGNDSFFAGLAALAFTDQKGKGMTLAALSAGGGVTIDKSIGSVTFKVYDSDPVAKGLELVASAKDASFLEPYLDDSGGVG